MDHLEGTPRWDVPPGTIAVPPFCNRHQRELVDRLGIGPDGPWRAAIVIANTLMFSWTTTDRRFNARLGDNDLGTMNLVLAEIGCLACFDRAGWMCAKLVMKKGLEHASLVSRGKIEDPDWPFAYRAAKLREDLR